MHVIEKLIAINCNFLTLPLRSSGPNLTLCKAVANIFDTTVLAKYGTFSAKVTYEALGYVQQCL